MPATRAAERLADAQAAMADARDTAVERVTDARDAAVERVTDARDAAASRVADAKAAAAEQIAKVKPRLRGVSHEYAFFVSLVLGAGLIVLAQGGEARLAVAIYAASLSALFGVSALYHRVDWQRPERAALDAPPRPHDDLLPDRRHRDPVRRSWSWTARWRPRC